MLKLIKGFLIPAVLLLLVAVVYASDILGPPDDPFDLSWLPPTGGDKDLGGKNGASTDTAVTLSQLIHTGFPTIVNYVDVVDENGDPIPGLTVDDFCVYQDGVPVPAFTVDSIMGDSCFTSVCLVMDVSGSMCTYPSYYWDDAKEAAHQFIENMDPFDRVSIITFSTCVDTIIDFTSDTAALHDAIDDLVCGGWTAAFDGIWTGVDLASTELGSKAVIAFTDGMENRSQYCWPPPDGLELDHMYSDDSILICNKATAAGIPIYTIGLGVPPSVEPPMQAFAYGTGGFYTYAPTAADMDFVYTKIKERLCKRYIITFDSPDTIQNGDIHEVVICLGGGSCDFGTDNFCDTGYYQETAPPEINLTPGTIAISDTCQPVNGDLDICANIVDLSPPYIQSAKLFYRVGTSGSYTSVNMTNTSGNTYCATIPGSVAGCGPIIQYYITASDGQGTVSSPSSDPLNNPYEIEICSNAPPVCSLPPDQTFGICADTTFNFAVSATDIDNNLVGCTKTSGVGSFDGSTWTFTTSGPGVYSATFECSDNCGEVCGGTVNITISSNSAPVCVLPVNQTIFQCAPVEVCLPVSATDVDNNLVDCVVTAGPGAISGGNWCYTPSGNETVNVTVKCTDVCGAFCEESFEIIFVMNSAPVCTVPANQTIFQCTPTEVCLPVSAVDVDGNLTGCTVVSGPGTITGGNWCYTPSGDETVDVTIRCTDDCDEFCEESFQIIFNINEAPVCTVPDDQTIFQCTPAQVCLPVSAVDADGNLTGCTVIDGPGLIVGGDWCYTPAGDETAVVTIRCTDDCGAFCEETFTITFDINEAPVCVVPADAAYFVCEDSTFSFPIAATDADGNLDACVKTSGVGSFDGSTWTFTTSAAGVYSATFECSDDCDEVCTKTVSMTVDYNEVPVITCPADVEVDCTASTDPANTGFATATDDNDPSPIVTYSDSETAGSCPQEKTITRTWQAMDDCGEVATCAQTITVVDENLPVITCPADLTIDCAVSTDPSNTGTATAMDACDPSPVVTYADVQTGDVITRTWTATDACGNSAQCIQTITIEDSTDPIVTCPPGISVQCLTDVPIPDIGLPTAFDDCDPNPVITFVSDISDNGSCPEIITRTYRATDASGNSADCTQTITVNDDTDPVITCPADIAIDCNGSADPSNTGMATATDNCDSDPAITYVDSQAGDVITRVWTATDDCGNAAQCMQTITLEDTTDPVVTCPGGISVQCLGDIPPADIGLVTVSDDCDPAPAITFIGDASDNGSCPEIITRTYRATDASGNFAECTQTITVNDDTDPVITCPADMAVQCNASTDPSNTGNATATDNCDADPEISHSDNVVGDVITRTWTAVDDCGNSVSCDQTITVEPNEPPVCNLPANQTFFVCADSTFNFAVSATDDQAVDCIMTAGDGSFDGSTWTFTTSDPGTYTATFVCTDICGDYCEATATMTVAYNSAPTCAAIDDEQIFQCAPTEICIPVEATDVDCNLAACDVVSGPGAIVGGEWCYTPSGNETASVTIQCTDECGEFCEESFEIEFTINERWAVLTIDRSGSMALQDLGGNSRLLRARNKAHIDIDKLLDPGDADYPGEYEIAIMSFNATSGIVLEQDFTSSGSLLHAAVSGINNPRHDTPLAAAMCQGNCLMPALDGCIKYMFTYTDGLENSSQNFDMCTLCDPCNIYINTGWNFDCDPNNPSTCTDWQLCLIDTFADNATNIVHYFGLPINPFGKSAPPEDMYFLKSTAEESSGAFYYYSDLEELPIGCGDANSDGSTNVSDAVYIINYVFMGGAAPDPLYVADANCDAAVNVSDAVYLINYVFVGGNPPCDTNADGIPDC